jgi:metal-sulfur cluster biosynthetic enzyme
MTMLEIEKLYEAIIQKMSTVIDPETGVDVVHMRLIEDLIVDENGHVAYKFRPSSFFCPIAVPLAEAIRQAVAEVPDVASQDVEVVGFALSEELTSLLRQAMDQAVQGKKKE